MSYSYHTTPYPHQDRAFDKARDLGVFAYLMEAGTGKSKVLLDDAYYNFQQGHIDTLVVFAPNGVHREWMTQVATHLPPKAAVAAFYRSGTKNTALVEVMRTRKKLRVVSLNSEILSSKKGLEYAFDLVSQGKTMVALDESQMFKTPSASRTRSAWKLGRLAVMRRILSGSSVTKGLEDLYGQYRFLSPDIIGCQTFAEFKALYTVTWGKYDQIVGYTNTDELMEKLAPWTYVCKLADCVDMPPQVFKRRPVEATAEQKRLYKDMATSYLMELKSGEIVEASLAITRLQKLQQITTGHVSLGGQKWEPVPAGPRLQAAVDLVAEAEGKVIVWAAWQPDILQLSAAFKKAGIHGVTYYGGNSANQNAKNLKLWREHEKAKVFLGTPDCGGRGLTLNEAVTVVNYSHSFDYEDRDQSLRRNWRIGQNGAVVISDLYIPGTINTRVLRSLEKKESIANLVKNAKELQDWLLVGDED